MPETRNCQNCARPFAIEPEDFAFYARINVPPPTWCPECRFLRRIQWMNFRTWYSRKINDVPVLSIYAPETSIPIMTIKQWWSDDWDAMNSGREYDFSRPFFTQYAELFRVVPRLHMLNDIQTVNSDYCNDVGNSRNSYLSTTIIESEEAFYTTTAVQSREVFDSLWMFKSDLCYQCIDAENSRGCIFSQNIDSCLDSAFLFNCRNVTNCIGCVGLRNASYCIFNKQVSKEEYQAFVALHLSGSYEKLFELQKKFEALKLTRPMRHAQIFHSVDCTGDNIRGGKNCTYCFDVSQELENLKYIVYGGLGVKDSYDCYNVGTSADLMYEGLLVGSNGSRIFFSTFILYASTDIQYSDSCTSSSNLFGCVGLKKKQYCILNKQYTKEEYEALLPKIVQHMNDMPYVDKAGRIYTYGEFFPAELSPFAHNETIAQEYFPMTKEEATNAGYRWRDPEEKRYTITTQASDLPDNTHDVQDAILTEIIGCEHGSTTSPQVPVCDENCTKAFRIVAKELDFYRRMNLPLPRLCPNCRYRTRFKKRNPLKLWPRHCNCGGETSVNSVYQNTSSHAHPGTEPCPNTFETSYSPDRPEIVYCESCYQAEVV